MQILKVHIENFGKLHDLDLEFHEGINIIRASNGWGKTTLAAFIKAMLYGMDYTTKRSLKENERRKYTPWQGGAFGGNMEIVAEGKHYRAERFFGARDKEDTFRFYDLETGLESQDYSEKLGEELFRLDRAAFERSSFFAQQDLAASLNDSLNARLTRVEEDAGDMQNYEKAVAALEEKMKYFLKTGNRGHISRLEQERRQVQEELLECRNKEAAVLERKERIASKESREEELRALESQTEKQIKEVQEYETRTEQKERYEQLLGQAGIREERLRQTGVELAQFTEAPLAEKILDRCHEEIYRINTLLLEEDDAGKKLEEAGRDLQEMRQEKEKLPKQSGKAVAFPVIILSLAAAAVFMAALKWYVPGILVIFAGCGLFLYLTMKNREAGKQIFLWEEENREKEQAFQASKTEYANVQKKRSQLEAELRTTLRVPKEVTVNELEHYWKLERQKNKEYAILKQNYSVQESELRRSRNAFQEYAGRFSEEELQRFRNLQKPEKETRELQSELEQYRRQREHLLEEKNSLQNQVKLLQESAERIPELEGESERLSQMIAEETKEHELLEKTVKYLKNAREQFSTRYLKGLQQGLEMYLAEFEPEEKKIPAVDVKLKVKMQEAGASRDLEFFSAGWQDMVRIAERFSILDALYEKEQPVVILDDPFVNLDTKKQKKAMELLGKLAEKRQMIYFTCHE